MPSTYRKVFIWIALFVFSILYNFYLLKIPVNIYDEGIILTGADRVLKKQLPYIDFWTMYPPGQYFTLAFLFKLFGTSILTERIYDIAVKSLLAIITCAAIKKTCSSNAIAITGWFIALIYIGKFEFPAYPVYSAILLILVGVYFIIDYIQNNKTQHLIYAGFIITTAFMFRHDLAGMAAISIIFTLFLKNILENKTFFRSGFTFISGMLLVGLPILIYLANAIGIPLIIDQILLTPAEIMPRYRSLSYPTSLSYNSIQFYVYPFVLFAGFSVSIISIIRLKLHNRLSYGLFLLSLIGIFFLNQLRVRSDSIHLLPVVLLSSNVGPILFYILYKKTKDNLQVKLSRASAYLLLTIITVPLINPVFQKIKSINSNYFTLSNNSYRSGYAYVEKSLQDLVLYIKNNTNINDTIYVGVDNHDHFIINDVIIYFLANRSCATKYHELHPGVTNTLNIQNDIIQEIEDTSAKLIILAPRYWKEPNETRIDSKIDCLDNYIREKYEFKKAFGIYKVWSQKSSVANTQQGTTTNSNSAVLHCHQ